MDRAMLERHLAQAERHIAEGEDHLARLRQLIDHLTSGRHDLKPAHDLLRTMKSSQTLCVADRNRLRAELAAIK